MWRLAVLIWIIAGTVFAGIALAVVTSVPALFDKGLELVPVLALAGFVLAVPVAILVARRIMATARPAG